MTLFRCVSLQEGVRRGLIVSGYGFGALLLVVLLTLRSRGQRQAASVAALVSSADFVCVTAQYEPYRYLDRYGLHKPVVPGTLSLVIRGGQRDQGFEVVGETPEFLQWTGPLLGEHCFVRVTDIYVSDENFSDADVNLLLAFPDVRELRLSGTAITDEGLTRILALHRLTVLEIDGTKVSASAIRRLSELKELRELYLLDTAADEQVVSELQHTLPDCEILR